MPSWGAPLKAPLRAIRGVARVARSPQYALRLAIRQVLMGLGIGFFMPIVALLIPTIEGLVKAYVDAEVKRKLEEERKTFYAEVSKEFQFTERGMYREPVPVPKGLQFDERRMYRELVPE